MRFDLQARQLQVVHSGPPDAVLARLKPLNLGADLQASAPVDSLRGTPART